MIWLVYVAGYAVGLLTLWALCHTLASDDNDEHTLDRLQCVFDEINLWRTS